MAKSLGSVGTDSAPSLALSVSSVLMAFEDEKAPLSTTVGKAEVRPELGRSPTLLDAGVEVLEDADTRPWEAACEVRRRLELEEVGGAVMPGVSL